MGSQLQQRVETGRRTVNAVAGEQKTIVNKATAANTELYKEAKGFSLTSIIGTAWSVASMALFLPGVFKGAIGLVGKLPKLGGISKTAQAAIDLHQVPVAQFVQKSKEAFGNTSRVAGALESGSKTVANFANKTLSKSNLGRTALSSMKEVSVGNLIMNGGFAVQQTASVALTMKDKISVLQQMQEDMTGKRPSKMAVLTGSSSLDPMVNKARGEAMGGKAVASMGMQLAGAAGSIYLGFFDKSKGKTALFKSLAIGFAPTLVSGFLTSSETTLTAYKQMTLSLAQTGHASEDIYRNVAIGFVPNAKSALVDKIARIGAEQNMAPKEYLQLMKEMVNPQTKPEITQVPGKFAQMELNRRAAANNGAMLQQA